MELKAEDLRINNYVHFLGKEKQVLGISKRNYNMGTETAGYYVEFKDHIPVNFIHIKPIQLNEEWLERFNAIKMHANYLGYKYSRFKLIWKESYKYWYVMDWVDETYMTKIEFVHDFQNFIKTMDNEELTIDNQ